MSISLCRFLRLTRKSGIVEKCVTRLHIFFSVTLVLLICIFGIGKLKAL
ncbi:hypothetical protein H206_02323, partial [Candidatus Electrothrix aarhusensis]